MANPKLYSNVLTMRERDLAVADIAQELNCSERTVRRLLEQGSRSEQRIVEFEEAWQSGSPRAIDDFVPPQGNPARDEILAELIRVDLEYRWRKPELSEKSKGETGIPARPLLDDYLRRFPELGTLDTLATNLIVEEYRVRERWGDNPAFSEYEQRFSNRKKSLHEHLERVHSEIVSEYDMGKTPPEESPEPVTAKNKATLASSSSSSPPSHRLLSSASRDTSEKYTTRSEPKKGGMAIVWRAFESTLNREVAYKEMRHDRAGDAEFQAMFLHKAQVTGQLEHPNIVPVYELGREQPDDRPFYTMKYVRGGTLSDAIEQFHERRGKRWDRIDLHRLLGIFLDVCNAISYAHSRGVLHRDLKPDNVMVGDFGEVLVVDWGLSKVGGYSESDLPAVRLTDFDQRQSEAGARKGTPAYWAPEQAEGRNDLVDVRTDIYGLGGILFEILTGRAPHDHEDAGSDNATPNLDVPNPRQIEPSVPGPLAAICSMAMTAKRSDRYSTVAELASDIERWTIDEPVTAHVESVPERVSRWIRRNRTASVVAVMALTAFVLVLGGMSLTEKVRQEENKNREIRALSEFASEEGTRLFSDIDGLRQDVTFLAALDEVKGVVSNFPDKTGGSESDGIATSNDAGTEENTDKEKLEKVFMKFLEQKPGYMQVRLIGADGHELVRVERSAPGSDVFVAPKLTDKKNRPYFVQTMRTGKGEWYLSMIELNQENGKKQKDVPVIRGAVPVFIENESSPVAIVIINLHFQELVRHLEEFEQRSENRMVYLTDAKGRFLYHPTRDLAFCFERNLEYRIQRLYPHFNQVFESAETRQHVALDADPQVALFIKPDARRMRDKDSESIYKRINERLAQSMVSLEAKYPELKWHAGDEGDAIVYGISETEMKEIADLIESKVGHSMDTNVVPGKLRHSGHAVYFNRLSLESLGDERFLGLAIVVPNDSFETRSSAYQWIFWSTLSLLGLCFGVSFYLVRRRNSQTQGSLATVPSGT